MKKTGLMLFCAAMLLTGCKENPQVTAEKQLAAVVSQVNLPHKVDPTTTLTGITLNNRVLTSRIEIPAERLSRIQPDSLSKAQVEQLATNLTSRKLREIAIKADVTLRYVYYNGSDSVVLELSPQALGK
ncbi:MAG: hypothetical protein K2H94_03185 [Duncaniella sp.]|nr:hypothetical protein [Duncaniella sp.]